MWHANKRVTAGRFRPLRFPKIQKAHVLTCINFRFLVLPFIGPASARCSYFILSLMLAGASVW